MTTTPTDTQALSLPLSRAAKHADEQPISELIKMALDDPALISLAAGLVDFETLPGQSVAPIIRDILADPAGAKAALQYGTTEGFAVFRQQLYDHLCALDDAQTDVYPGSADDVVVTTGSQQLLNILAEVLLDADDIVIAGWPSYFVYTSTLTAYGATIRSVDLDEHGMVPEKLDRLLAGLSAAGQLHRVKFLYVVSYHQNPTGITLSAERRQQLLDIVKHYSAKAGHRIVLVEDAAYRELTYQGEAPPSIKSMDDNNQYVALCQTFSKPFAPGLKTGYGLLPSDLVEAVKLSKGGRDFGSSNFNMHIISRAMSSGAFAQHVGVLKRAYAAKIQATLDALEEHFTGIDGVSWTDPTGGLYVWLTLPEAVDTSRPGPLFGHAIKQGVLFVPGVYCYPNDPTRTAPTNTIRLAVGVPNPKQVREGIARLAQAVGQVLG
ncbi:MAG: PLP-dependent aminotransferase family protein [Phycisphaeraceae bacterium]|nr:PLP-dependent aminotransferase family protein [Phycisphaeraceae bacterium]